jgi:hypothetical protein
MDTSVSLGLSLPNEIIELIIKKLSYPTNYKLHLECNLAATTYLLNNGKRIISQLGNYINPNSKYYPIPDDFDFTNLEKITQHIWNMLIYIEPISDSDKYKQLMLDVCSFLTMESPAPDSYNDMRDNIWEEIIVQYLDSEYDSTLDFLGEYKTWNYIFIAIEEYAVNHGLDSIDKQKHALVLLIMTFLDLKHEIMHMYDGEVERIDTDKKYYEEFKRLIKTISRNGHLDTEMISDEFVKNTFYFMHVHEIEIDNY